MKSRSLPKLAGAIWAGYQFTGRTVYIEVVNEAGVTLSSGCEISPTSTSDLGFGLAVCDPLDLAYDIVDGPSSAAPTAYLVARVYLWDQNQKRDYVELTAWELGDRLVPVGADHLAGRPLITPEDVRDSDTEFRNAWDLGDAA